MADTLYFDHNATTPLKPEAKDAMLSVLDMAGNASAVHKSGRQARRRLEEARINLGCLVNADSRAVIVFTSGATEANNTVLKGCGAERFIVSAVEHPSVLNARKDADLIPVDKNGIVDLEKLEEMLSSIDCMTLVSVMLANNETGVIQPVKQVVELARKYGALVHTDAVQAIGRIPVDIQDLGVDYMTISSHKMGGPQGVGALVLANCVKVAPLLHGGAQEKSMRAGTENLAGIVGFGKTAELASVDIEDYQKLGALRDHIEQTITDVCPKIKILGKDSPRLCNTTLFTLEGVPSENQLLALDTAGIEVSNGSACASGTVKTSHVLEAMGLDPKEAQSAIRISLGWNTTKEDVEAFLKIWREVYTRIMARLTHAA